ncbi:MAG: sigma-54 dependent transcriptional regulator, partial [Candidatus Marinimicrobia bacterium]|nr:sigma-54 dependent transcriptional regulator [Candidatus Neomarinimicrobiota bacterium]
MNRILLIDDDLSLSRVIGYQLESSGFEVRVVNSGREGINLFKAENFQIVVTDIQMPDISGIDVLEAIRKLDQNVIVILITAFGSIDNAVEACRLGANDYLTKPFGQEQLLFVIEKALRFRELESENIQLKKELKSQHQIHSFITNNKQMKDVLEVAAQIAESNTTTLILGESGTGKELIAKAMHYNSPRSKQPLITVNCPSIPDNLLESELFGHIKGSFTGALKDRRGKFELADGGSIFLDEIGDLQEALQAKLLRVLQEQEIERLGDDRTIKVDVRIIAATNKDLMQLVAAGKFREDLYYRLNVIPITIPPLRDRIDDIPFLITHFLDKYAAGRKLHIQPEVITSLEHYPWPGNVRELENKIKRGGVLAEGKQISAEDLGLAEKEASLPLSLNLRQAREVVEKKTIRQA